MNNTIKQKIIAGMMLSSFVLSNGLMAAFAMENPMTGTTKPALRDTQQGETSLRLKGDVSFVKRNPAISISLRDSDVKQVLRMFADKAGMNIVFHDSVSGKVTLDLVNVPLSKAFDMVMEINDLNYAVDDGTLIVAKAGTSGFNFAKQDMTLIPVKYVSAAALAEFLNKNIYAMHKAGLSDTDIVSTNPTTNELIVFGSKADVQIAKKVVAQFDRKPKTTVYKVNYTTPAEMADMICNMLLPATSGDSAGSSSSSGSSSSGGSSTGGAAGIMTGAASDSGSDGESSSSSDSGSSSGSSGGSSGGSLTLNGGTVACTIDGKLSGSVSSFGLQNMAVAYYPQLGTINVIGGSEHQLEMISDFIKDTDKKQPQAYLEVSIVELNESGSKSLSNKWTFLSNVFSATFDGSNTGTHPVYPVFFKGKEQEVWDVKDGAATQKDPLKMYKGPMTISYAVNFLVENSKGRVVANPRILVTNGEESTIDITQDYVESTSSEQSAYTGGTIATRTYNIGSDAGIKISITPFISPDGYVTMNIKPEYSTILSQLDAKDSIGPYTAATLLSHRNLDLKNVRIKDGETLVIAGMINEEEQKSVGKVPVLGDLPVIGSMFRSSSSKKQKNEMVIMITPKIVTDTEDAVGTDAL